ncbi:hypothetical protein A3K79_00710 [Candidatus Bathyarchaeota archaeon RBG_13_46_16b]|nr:MAG: hypothetical protein A3K79_00710 [Candidatus Bathyarchaeota archaeon RBG_13_46_16b]
MTVIDRGKLRQSVYELVENDDSILDSPQGKEAIVDALTQAFLEGSLSVSYGSEDNALHWRLLQVPVASASCVELSSIGANLAEKGMLDDAVAVLEQAAKLCPRDAVTRVNLGHAYQDKGLLDKAVVQYKRALEIDPSIVDAHERLGTAYASKGLLSKAIACYKRALRLNPSDSTALCNLGKAYLDKGWTDKALEQLKQAVKANPASSNAHNTLATAYSKRGFKNEAIEEFKQAMELDPKTTLYHDNLASEYYKNRMWNEAIEEYKLLTVLEPESAAAHNNLGAAYGQKTMWNKALKEFERAVELDLTLEIAQENLKNAQEIEATRKKRLTYRKKGKMPFAFREAKSYDLLNKFENQLRKFIQESMERAFGKEWWKQRVPSDIQSICHERKRKREGIPWDRTKDLQPIYYADFAHYLPIITNRGNWKSIFSWFFYDEAWIKTRLQELNIIRTDTMHNRKITPRNARRLEDYTADILYCVRRKRRSLP